MSSLLEAALEYQSLGLSIIPIGAGKRPACARWTPYQSSAAGENQLRAWFSPGSPRGLAIINGAVSKNLETLDFDNAGELFPVWARLVNDENPELVRRLALERSPSGGYHVPFRCPLLPTPGNQKLAVRAIPCGSGDAIEINGKQLTPRRDETGRYRVLQTLIETRGEGGYVVAAPTPGYEFIRLGAAGIPLLSPRERDTLIRLARSLNEHVEPRKLVSLASSVRPSHHLMPSHDGARPGDEFNRRGDVRPVLERHGWTPANSNGIYQRFCRPGKDAGVSASLIDGQVFHVFSSNAPPFEDGRGYSKFSVYTMLEHDGDASAAARALAMEGYGKSNGSRGASEPASTPCASSCTEQEQRPEFVPPAWDEVHEAIHGSPIEAYVEEARALGPSVPEELLLMDALFVAGLAVSRSGARLVVDEWDEDGARFNFYYLKLARSGRGKGVTTKLALRLADMLGVPAIRGKSEPAIIEYCREENAGNGYYYMPEVAKLLDEGSAVAGQVSKLFLEAFDAGRLDYTTRPRGKLVSLCLEDVYPSLLVEAQPLTIEAYPGSRNLSAGTLARFIVAAPPASPARFRKTGYPNMAKLRSAFEPYASVARESRVLYPTAFACRAEDYQPHMTDAEAASWSRLAGQHAPKIAALIAPACFSSGRVQPGAMDRAAIIADYLFANAQKLLGLIHRDPKAALRARAERYIQGHSGCTDRDLYRHLDCSKWELERDIAPTIIARGTATKNSKRWFPSNRRAAGASPQK